MTPTPAAALNQETTTARAAAAPREPVLSLKDVGRRFVTSRHETVALEGITLDMHAGEFVVVVGPSGCGKSTLLNLVAGLDKPSAGSIAFDGRPVKGAAADRVVVFQDHALYPGSTCARTSSSGCG
jgi:NitT/TauT family transport system ATP-binding protein